MSSPEPHLSRSPASCQLTPDVILRAEFEACEGRRAALSAVCQTLQTEMLQLYAQVQTDAW